MTVSTLVSSLCQLDRHDVADDAHDLLAADCEAAKASGLELATQTTVNLRSKEV